MSQVTNGLFNHRRTKSAVSWPRPRCVSLPSVNAAHLAGSKYHHSMKEISYRAVSLNPAAADLLCTGDFLPLRSVLPQQGTACCSSAPAIPGPGKLSLHALCSHGKGLAGISQTAALALGSFPSVVLPTDQVRHTICGSVRFTEAVSTTKRTATVSVDEPWTAAPWCCRSRQQQGARRLSDLQSGGWRFSVLCKVLLARMPETLLMNLQFLMKSIPSEGS